MPPTYRLALGALSSPNALLERMVDLEAEAILLGGTFYQLARVEEHRAAPLRRLENENYY